MRSSKIWAWMVQNREVLIFSILILAYLTPILAFTYLPTQDGPAHLNNAQIFRDCFDPTSDNAHFFELRDAPMPNLSSQVVLAGLLCLLPPLFAEKVLVSAYVVGFAVGYRYFLGAFGPRCVALSWIGLLFVYQRCFWMGFFNYCFGMVVLWFILGFWLRRRNALNAFHAPVLMCLFVLAFFTHLIAFLLALVGTFGIAILTARRRLLPVAVVVVAALPAAVLTWYYFDATGFFRSRAPVQFSNMFGQGRETTFKKDLLTIDEELCAHHVGSEVPGTLILLFLLVLLAVFTLVEPRASPEEADDRPGRLFPAIFGWLLFAAYFLAPSHLGAHGGFLKTRFAPLFFLVWISCLRESGHWEARLFFRSLTVLLLVLNLSLVLDTVASGNRDLERYNAGLDAVGTGHRLFIIQPDPNPSPLVDPLLHAADYYCLGTNNVNFDNYQAETIHFPLKYRPGIQRGRNYWGSFRNRHVVDTILWWRTPGASGPRAPAGWVEIFRQDPLAIYRRPE